MFKPITLFLILSLNCFSFDSTDCILDRYEGVDREEIIELNLSHCKMYHWSEESLIGFDNVKVLFLHGENYIDFFPSKAFQHMPKLETIWLDQKSKYDVDPEAFEGLKYLKNVYFSNHNTRYEVDLPKGLFRHNHHIENLSLAVSGKRNLKFRSALRELRKIKKHTELKSDVSAVIFNTKDTGSINVRSL